MSSHLSLRTLVVYLGWLIFTPHGFCATTSSGIPSPSSSPTTSPAATIVTSAAAVSTSSPPDVLLHVPNLSVGRIELDVDNLQADINLNAQIASLVSVNAGVTVSVQTINLTIVDIEAELDLIVRLGNLADIVNRVFQSLDLNPLLIDTLNNVTSILEPIVGAVDGLLGTITQGGTALSFVVDNLGNIVQEVAGTGGSLVSSIVGNYLTNMTFTGVSESLGSGLTEKTYSYSPLNALVDSKVTSLSSFHSAANPLHFTVVFNSAGQVVQATVAKQTASTTSSSVTSSTSVSTSASTTAT